MVKIYRTDIGQGIVKGVSRGKRIFGGEPLEKAKILFNISQF